MVPEAGCPLDLVGRCGHRCAGVDPEARGDGPVARKTQSLRAWRNIVIVSLPSTIGDH